MTKLLDLILRPDLSLNLPECESCGRDNGDRLAEVLVSNSVVRVGVDFVWFGQRQGVNVRPCFSGLALWSDLCVH